MPISIELSSTLKEKYSRLVVRHKNVLQRGFNPVDGRLQPWYRSRRVAQAQLVCNITNMNCGEDPKALQDYDGIVSGSVATITRFDSAKSRKGCLDCPVYIERNGKN